jgi:hypothetical protein
MAGENWLAGNWSVRELVDRLEQVGVKADVAAESSDSWIANLEQGIHELLQDDRKCVIQRLRATRDA